MRHVTWQSIADGVDEAIRACRDVGLVDLVERSRFSPYRQRLGELNEAIERGGDEAAREVFDRDRIVNGVALGECAELATLVPFIQSQARETIRPKLERMLIGPVVPTDEDQNSNLGRNTLFELNLASKLWTASLAPLLGERPDLCCEIDGRPLLIELHRTQTRARLEAELGAAEGEAGR